MNFQLPPLSYPYDAFEPYISKDTMHYHYDKHYGGYIKNTNELKKGTAFENLSLTQIVKSSEGKLFNNVAQAFNHKFYFNSLSPKPTSPSDQLLAAIEETFSSLSKFKEEFIEKASSLFGSGWTWLIKDENNKVFILNTQNAETPITEELKPILVCDIWEHAYYLDYKNERVKYLNSFFELINWDFASKNFVE
ncbi:superoxide dismutase [Nitrosophilus labii]|uniref:superoxide dismutase n=1 Tax=Nitrosophilus labii TaxID=2706014 RepID=UPI001656A0D3|nr:superoxide dismutase [Nitrosophilus labii]